MKTSMIALAFAAFATAGFAHASEVPAASAGQSAAAQIQQWNPSQTGAMQKTRAEVRHELVQAQQDGQLAQISSLYRGS
ncbi:hypothetical protein R69927_02296 [Paraburkholderia domus]|jgi:hypothetical protein|uniref:DUF4148 domain-containing protein n=1 Tax=Paraburkholderia domus TaxID=2793075 RepID=A0A9N8MWK3_9BURK|nr:DUF4148 domain-containing protein [Paraburkholderia domus]MBK5049526.1 DUF4148 domain-containing protein [Burkholderia sp. R-70006]MBK5061911.1 DUF4148 domain-containing protein [Burkholderia sp. R-70199]MBK5087164.1 DUF4148 domain-containing protein [Burkholderia sp. R-69927]MBK5123519.1 DUF4148 domain-containing protein [Burkholderia sp. R-69980]MBK5166751.1 DUF4148 domain-containing protein [Burkholderia sp. R-70211]MBK5180900.1 DUF4148 domain-containing protein [Burkholderia sp. R-6974